MNGKGDKPRKVTKQYEENYQGIFPNAFKPSWQIELEKQESEKKSKKTKPKKSAKMAFK